MKNKEKKDSKLVKRIKVIICLAASLLVVTLATLIIIITSKLKDHNKSPYEKRNEVYTEIVKKNFIDGFKNSKDTGKFRFIMPKEDVNELLCSGVKQLNDNHIKTVYFDLDDNGFRYFFVGLTKVGIKTRVVITTIPSVKDESTISLSIYSASIGKVDALSFLQNRGYLTSKFINPYLEACHLPISFNETSLSFEIKPYKWVNMFPRSFIGDYIFSESKSLKDAYSFNSNLFGFDLDLTKLSKGYEYIDVDIDNTPNIYEEVKSGCLDNYDEMISGENRTIYSLNEEGLNKIVKKSLSNNMSEEITSSLTSNKAIFNLAGCNTVIESEDKIKFRLFFSINGYMLSLESYLTYFVQEDPSVYFKAHFEKSINEKGITNEAMLDILSSLSNTYDNFEFNEEQSIFSLNLQSLNSDSDVPVLIKYSEKSIVLNPVTKSIDFNITK